MRGPDVRAQRDVIAAIVPVVADSCKQIFDFKVFVVGNRELLEVEVNPAGLFLRGIEVDGDENSIAFARFAVAEDVGIIDGMKVERTVALQGGIFTADLVNLSNQRSEAVSGRAVPMADLIFFAVEVLFTSLLCGDVFTELEGWCLRP